MKKNILLASILLASIGLLAFSYLNRSHLSNPIVKNNSSDPELVYKVSSRFIATITKEELNNARSILDIVPPEAKAWWTMDFENVVVGLIQEEGEQIIPGKDKNLSLAQLALLNKTGYSSNFFIRARSDKSDPEYGRPSDYAYYFTVVPEKQAEYIRGYDALISYLKFSSQTLSYVIEEDKLQPGQVSFTITEDGAIENVKLLSSSGYSFVDKGLLETIKNMPGLWKPAENSKGERVRQELIFFFGKEGC